MGKKHFQFRAPEELVERVEEVADQLDVSKSETARSLISWALANGGAEEVEHVEVGALVEQIMAEEFGNKREAWFRSNVGGRLLTCFNAGLTPEEAEKDLNGYRREAEELHSSAEFVEYVEEGLGIYADAYQRDRSGMLKEWVKARDADPSAIPDDVADDPAEQNVADTTASTSTYSEQSYRDQVENSAYLVENGSFRLSEVNGPADVEPETFREDVQAVADAEDPESVDLRGGTDE